MLLVVIYNSVYQVQPDERGVVLRFGTFNRIAEPGLHFALWPVETMEKPKVGAVRQINIGNEGSDGQMLTSDKNIINVPFSVFWRIKDAKELPLQRRRPGAGHQRRQRRARCARWWARPAPRPS